jgi:hypothetical protein
LRIAALFLDLSSLSNIARFADSRSSTIDAPLLTLNVFADKAKHRKRPPSLLITLVQSDKYLQSLAQFSGNNTHRCKIPRSKPLPDCDGPKLECFLDDITTDNFKILGFSGSGAHAQVWKAEIHGEVYAIKIVSASPDQSPC